MATKWNLYTPKQLKAEGWLKNQLKIQANGLSGNLDKVWRDVKDSAWIGGDADGWERVPYWLDGFIPLAYLLEDDDMISRAKKYVDAIIEKQKNSGWICPCDENEITSYDSWAVQLISKALLTYYRCSNDERIPNVLYKLLKNYYNNLNSGKIKLFDWGKFRWFECFVSLNFLYERYREPWIIDLGKILKNQGADFDKIAPLWKKPFDKGELTTHIVNVAMSLKSEAITCDILGEEYVDRAEYYYKILKNYNGTPVDLFTGDEHLCGLSPIHGTELCAVVELMYSYENLFAYTGDEKWLERLEFIAFNALPATLSDDMWAHQYDQMSNQISCEKFLEKPIFVTNGIDSHLFGLEPNFGCCTANFSQGWPKFALSAFMYDGDKVINAIPVPSTLKTEIFSVSLQTEYPFKNTFKYCINAKNAFKFIIRIPPFAKKLSVNGKSCKLCKELTFDITEGESEILVCYQTQPELIDRPYNLKSVKCGSLVFSLPISYKKIKLEYVANGVERKYPYCDYEYTPQTDWNYGLSDVEFFVIEKNVNEVPFSSENPPIIVKAKMKKIAWGTESGYEKVCAKVPKSNKPIGEEEIKELYPYGCAKLRITEMPLTE